MNKKAEVSSLLETFLKIANPHPSADKTALKHDAAQSDVTLASDPSISGERPATYMPQFSVGSIDASNTQLDYQVEQTLGEGGMGIVCLATQTSLDREVALKEPKNNVEKTHASARLIHEARIAGQLEHPNIIPVHDLGWSSSNLPILVMKRIHGVSWIELLRNPEHPAWQKLRGNRLVWNLNVFIKLCNAIEYAHSKNIVHRDIKPENVMIGEFGEVYLLDWGLGFDWSKPLNPIVPIAAGTPAYMAPEMLDSVSSIGPHTDIYLLGATLYELLCGHGPHSADSVSEALEQVLTPRKFFFPEETPKMISQICQKAIEHKAADRFQSVSELRSAIEDFLHHMSSSELAAEAGSKGELFSQMATVYVKTEDSSVNSEELYKLYYECRFAYELSLKQWPTNPHALSGLRSIIVLMIRIEIHRCSISSARALYAELDAPEESLAKEIAEFEEQAESRKKRTRELEQFAYERDENVGAQVRRSFLQISILSSIILLIVNSIKPTTFDSSITALLWYWLFAATPLAIVAYRNRNLLWANQRSKEITGAFVFFFVALLVLRIAALLFDISLIQTLKYELVGGIVYNSMLAVAYYPLAWICAGLGVLSTGLLIYFPSHPVHIIGAYYLCITVIYYLILREKKPNVAKEG